MRVAFCHFRHTLLHYQKNNLPLQYHNYIRIRAIYMPAPSAGFFIADCYTVIG